MKKSVLVFCGSSTGNNEQIRREACLLGKSIAANGLRLIYGGGNIGLMGLIANEVLQNGGEVLGVIPRFLLEKEVGNLEVTELKIVKSMHERKAYMCDQADMIVTMPGGFGTLDEFFEMLTWLQLGLHTKPIGVLNTEGFFDSLFAQLDHMLHTGFISQPHRNMVIEANEAEQLLASLMSTKMDLQAKL